MGSRTPTELRHPGATPDCPECQGSGIAIVRDGELAVARPCRCRRTCPLCKGTGLVAMSDAYRARRRRCVCQVVEARMRAFDAAHVPARHASSTRASFKPTTSKQGAVVMAVSKYLSDFDPNGENRGLVLYGEVGRGKTHLMVALVRDLIMVHGVRAKFVEFSHLLADLKAGFDIGRGMAQLIDPLVEVEVLAIDELGKGRNTEFEGTVLDELVSRRYNAMRPILATTNYSPTATTGRSVANMAEVALGTASVPGLADRVGDRVFSRLRETCDFVEVKGDDYRQRRGSRPRG
jgi:DNA replication protein DnaC